MSRIVIDHAGKPDIAAGHWLPWAHELQRISAETAASCKLSGLLTQGDSTDFRVLGPWMRHVLECFGPERILWGSDWPVLEQVGSYERWWQVSREMTSAFDASEQEAIFGGNARRIYRLDSRRGASSLG